MRGRANAVGVGDVHKHGSRLARGEGTQLADLGGRSMMRGEVGGGGGGGGSFQAG